MGYHTPISHLQKQMSFFSAHTLVFFLAANLNTIYRNNLRQSAPMWSSAATPLPAPPSSCRRSASAAARYAADWAGRCREERGCSGGTPTCRIRFWCSGGGGPPSGVVLLEEAIFKSLSEPPPLTEWLSSELLDILSRGWLQLEAARSARGPSAGARWIRVAGLRIRTALRGPGPFCGGQRQSGNKRDTVWKKPAGLSPDCQTEKWALPPFRDAPRVLLCACVCVSVYVCGGVNAPQMRFPETPQDQCCVHGRSETSQRRFEQGDQHGEKKKWFVGSPVAEIRSVWPKSNSQSDIG